MRGMMAVISLISGSSSPAAIFGCADSVCSTSVVPERGKPRMKIGCGTSVRTPARGISRSRPAVKKLRSRSICCFAASSRYDLAGQFARQPLAFGEGGPGVVVAAQSDRAAGPFPAARSGRACASPVTRRIDQRQRLVVFAACARAAPRASAARRDRWGTACPSGRAPRRRRRNCGRLPPAGRSRAGSGGSPARRRRIPRRARAPPPCGPGSSGSTPGWRAGSDRAAPVSSSTRR